MHYATLISVESPYASCRYAHQSLCQVTEGWGASEWNREGKCEELLDQRPPRRCGSFANIFPLCLSHCKGKTDLADWFARMDDFGTLRAGQSFVGKASVNDPVQLDPQRKKAQFDFNWSAAVKMLRKNKRITILHSAGSRQGKTKGRKLQLNLPVAWRINRSAREQGSCLFGPRSTPVAGFESTFSCASTEREAAVPLAWLPIL